MPEPLYWREPGWLLLAIYPLLLLGWRRWRERRVLDGYADRPLQPWVRVARSAGRRRALSWPAVAMVLCWVLLSIALAGPRLPLAGQGLATPGELVAIIDLSRSMTAGDLQPSRRSHAIALVRGWLHQSPRPAIGLVLFAGRAHAYLPPTRDRRILDQYLLQLQQIALPTLGNDLAGALASGHQWLAGHSPAGLVLLSDGDLEESARSSAEEQMARLAEDGVGLDVIGIGGSQAVPLRDVDGEWLLDRGQPVVSALQGDWLARLAATGGGRYHAPVAGGGPRLAEVWRHGPARITDGAQARLQWQELYPWALTPAVMLLLVLLLGPGRLGRWSLGLLLLPGLAGLTEPVRAAAGAETAWRALQAGDYARAREAFEVIDGYAGRFGVGVSCYRLSDYDCARSAFADAAWLADDRQARGRAVFNLANSRFQLGDYERAISLYEDVIRQGVAVPQAQANLAFTRELLAEVKRLAGQQVQVERRPAKGPRSAAGGLIPPAQAARRRLATEAAAEQPAAGQVSAEEYAQLLARGIARLQLLASGGTDTVRHRRTGAWVEREDLAASVPGARIWQRLFEIDEGFPAPLEQPRRRPGQRPW